jgi:hypothetical protein
MSEARRIGFTALRLTLAALGLTVGCCALTLLLGVDEAHAHDSVASPFAPPAAAATDPTGDASRTATGDVVANSAMPALEAVAAPLETVTVLPVPVAEPAVEAIAPLVESPAESVVPALQAAAERVTPIAQATLEPIAAAVLEPVATVIPPLLNNLAHPLTPVVEAPTTELLEPAPGHAPAAIEPQRAVDGLATHLSAAVSLAAESGIADHPDEIRPSAPTERSPVTPTPVASLSASGTVPGAPSATTDDGQLPVSMRTITAPQLSDGALPAGPSFDPGSTPD